MNVFLHTSGRTKFVICNDFDRWHCSLVLYQFGQNLAKIGWLVDRMTWKAWIKRKRRKQLRDSANNHEQSCIPKNQSHDNIKKSERTNPNRINILSRQIKKIKKNPAKKKKKVGKFDETCPKKFGAQSEQKKFSCERNPTGLWKQEIANFKVRNLTRLQCHLSKSLQITNLCDQMYAKIHSCWPNFQKLVRSVLID